MSSPIPSPALTKPVYHSEPGGVSTPLFLYRVAVIGLLVSVLILAVDIINTVKPPARPADDAVITQLRADNELLTNELAQTVKEREELRAVSLAAIELLKQRDGQRRSY